MVTNELPKVVILGTRSSLLTLRRPVQYENDKERILHFNIIYTCVVSVTDAFKVAYTRPLTLSRAWLGHKCHRSK